MSELLHERPVVGGALLPFACVADDGTGRHHRVVKARALRCALSRVCGVCGESLVRPMAFLGTTTEVEENLFAFPASHVACLREVAADAEQSVGHVERPAEWTLVEIGGFDVVRPTRRGDPVHFRPNTIVDRETLT